MAITNEMISYAESVQDEIKDLIRTLCQYPAPSNREDKRAEFVKDWFKKECGIDAFIDGAVNVICPVGVTDNNDVVAIIAHSDTVFPDLEPMPFKEENGFFYSPGVTDDTAHLAILMICIRYFVKSGKKPKNYGIVFAANSGEEGLGNLRGSRMIVDTYGSRLKELITWDGGTLNRIINEAVGSHRYKVTVQTEGGHSFSDFGHRNAIHYLASIINSLYAMKVPQEGSSKTTYNVGTISGGTSVNTICQEASMLYEYRSDSMICLNKMKDMFYKVIEAYRAMGIEIEVELLGDRPCSGPMTDEAKAEFEDLISRAVDSINRIVGEEPKFLSGSTDSNYPLYKGIPSVCIGACVGGQAHTREEWLDLSSILPGSKLVLDFVSHYFED